MDKKNELVLLGKTAVDAITGFKGTVTSVCVNLYESTRCQLEAEGEPGKGPLSIWLGIDRLELTAARDDPE